MESVSEILIFVPKSGCSLKKKRSSLGIGLRNSYFRPKIIVPLLVIDKACAKLFRGPVVGPHCYKPIEKTKKTVQELHYFHFHENRDSTAKNYFHVILHQSHDLIRKPSSKIFAQDGNCCFR